MKYFMLFGLFSGILSGCVGSSESSTRNVQPIKECVILSDLTLEGSSGKIHQSHQALLDGIGSLKDRLSTIRLKDSYRYDPLEIKWGSVEGDKGAQTRVTIFDGSLYKTLDSRKNEMESAMSQIKSHIEATDPKKQKGSYYLSALREWSAPERSIVLIGDLAIEEDDLHFEKGDIQRDCAKLERRLSDIFALKGKPRIKLESAISTVVGSSDRRTLIEQCWNQALTHLGVLENVSFCDDYIKI